MVEEGELSRVGHQLARNGGGFSGIRNCMDQVKIMEKQWETQMLAQVRQQLAEVKRQLTPKKFLPQVPNVKPTGEEIPDWQREMMAKKKAEAAYHQEEAKIMARFEEWKQENAPQAPEWQRNLPKRSGQESVPILTRRQIPHIPVQKAIVVNGPSSSPPSAPTQSSTPPWQKQQTPSFSAPRQPPSANYQQRTPKPTTHENVPVYAPSSGPPKSRNDVSQQLPSNSTPTHRPPPSSGRLANFWNSRN